MRAARLLSLLMLLQTRGRMSAAALARQLEVSVRTVYRDADALSGAGVPVYAELGRNGGIALRQGYRTQLTGITRAEAEALPLAGLGTAAADLGFGQAAASAQLKVLASLSPDASAGATLVGARFHLDPIPWYHRVETPACLAALASAVWTQQRVRIDYEGWKGPARRVIDPLGLVQKAGIWYVVGAGRRGRRIYRVSGIVRLAPTGRSFQRPARFDLARHWAVAIRDFEARLMGGRATVRLSAEARSILRATQPMAAQLVESTQRPCRPGGWVEAQVPIEGIGYSARQLLGLGGGFRVIAPAALRQAVATEARRVLAQHRARRQARPRAARR